MQNSEANKIYNFKIYEPRHHTRKIPCVTISNKYVYFNKACWPFFQRKDYCHLFFDKRNKAIAFRPTHVEDLNTIKIYKGNRANCKVVLRDFLKKELWDIFGKKMNEQGRRFEARFDDKAKCLIVDLVDQNGRN